MKKILLLLCLFISSGTMLLAQGIYNTRSGQIKFFSRTPVEDIEAVNNQAVSKLDGKTGQLNFIVLIKGFVFENELMQKHFNDDYMQSSKLPKAEFKGKIAAINKVNFMKEGNYPVRADGALTIHGVTRAVKVPGTLTVSKGKLSLRTVFKIKVKDYGITGSDIGTSISNELEITVNCKYD